MATLKGNTHDIFDKFDNQKEHKLKDFYVNLDKKLRLDGGPDLTRVKSESNFSFKNQPRGGCRSNIKAANNITTRREGELKFHESMSKAKPQFKSIFSHKNQSSSHAQHPDLESKSGFQPYSISTIPQDKQYSDIVPMGR